MDTITIPRKLIKGDDLVIISRTKYEKLLRALAEKERLYSQLDKELDETIAEYRAGKFFGPFNTVEEGIDFLKKQKTAKIKR